jgi:formylglycine-generating enzyme required for sulfatase activity
LKFVFPILLAILLSSCGPQPTAGMVRIPGGTFMMGSEADYAFPNERPAHQVEVAPFFLDAKPVSNADFKTFVEATGYKTIAERPVDWEELKKQVPPGTPKPPDEVLAPGSLVFRPTEGPVDLRDMSQWWVWTTGASWRHPEGPGSTIEGRESHPVVHVAWEDAAAYDCRPKRNGNSLLVADWKTSATLGETRRIRTANSWSTAGPENFLTTTTKRTALSPPRLWGFFPRTDTVFSTWAAMSGIGAATSTAPTLSPCGRATSELAAIREVRSPRKTSPSSLATPHLRLFRGRSAG